MKSLTEANNLYADPRGNTIHLKLNRKRQARGDSLIGSVNDYFRDLLLFSNILYEETYIFFVRTRRTKLTFAFEW